MSRGFPPGLVLATNRSKACAKTFVESIISNTGVISHCELAPWAVAVAVLQQKASL